MSFFASVAGSWNCSFPYRVELQGMKECLPICTYFCANPMDDIYPGGFPVVGKKWQ